MKAVLSALQACSKNKLRARIHKLDVRIDKGKRLV